MSHLEKNMLQSLIFYIIPWLTHIAFIFFSFTLDTILEKTLWASKSNNPAHEEIKVTFLQNLQQQHIISE